MGHRAWRVKIIYLASNYPGFGEVIMRSTPGGAQICTGGTVLYSGQYNGTTYAAANAFNGNTSTGWAANSTGFGWIGYDFGVGANVDVVEISLYPRDVATATATDILVEYSDDLNTWVPVMGVSGMSGWSAGVAKTYSIPTPDRLAHDKWRVAITENNGSSYVSVSEFEFRAAIGGADQISGGAASVSGSYNATYDAPKACDDNNSTYWTVAWDNRRGAWWMYDFAASIAVAEFVVKARTDTDLNGNPKVLALQYSDDGVIWTTVHAVTGQTGWSLGESRVFSLPSMGFSKSGALAGTGTISGVGRAGKVFYGLLAATASIGGAWPHSVLVDGSLLGAASISGTFDSLMSEVIFGYASISGFFTKGFSRSGALLSSGSIRGPLSILQFRYPASDVGMWGVKKGPWEFERVIKHNYNQGHRISPDFEGPWPMKSSGKPITPIHDPFCGYWPLGPATGPSGEGKLGGDGEIINPPLEGYPGIVPAFYIEVEPFQAWRQMQDNVLYWSYDEDYMEVAPVNDYDNGVYPSGYLGYGLNWSRLVASWSGLDNLYSSYPLANASTRTIEWREVLRETAWSWDYLSPSAENTVNGYLHTWLPNSPYIRQYWNVWQVYNIEGSQSWYDYGGLSWTSFHANDEFVTQPPTEGMGAQVKWNLTNDGLSYLDPRAGDFMRRKRADYSLVRNTTFLGDQTWPYVLTPNVTLNSKLKRYEFYLHNTDGIYHNAGSANPIYWVQGGPKSGPVHISEVPADEFRDTQFATNYIYEPGTTEIRTCGEYTWDRIANIGEPGYSAELLCHMDEYTNDVFDSVSFCPGVADPFGLVPELPDSGAYNESICTVVRNGLHFWVANQENTAYIHEYHYTYQVQLRRNGVLVTTADIPVPDGWIMEQTVMFAYKEGDLFTVAWQCKSIENAQDVKAGAFLFQYVPKLGRYTYVSKVHTMENMLVYFQTTEGRYESNKCPPLYIIHDPTLE